MTKQQTMKDEFLVAVLDEVNRRIPSKTSLTYQRGDERKRAGMAQRRMPGTLHTKFLQDAAALSVSQFWADYFATERDRVGALFRELATRGNLSADDWQEQIENFNRGAPMLSAKMQGARPTLNAPPRFTATDPDPRLNADMLINARIAYALLSLDDSAVRVLQCKHCHDLFLAKRGTTGRPRSEFCQYAHANAYAQAQTRLRRRKREAAAARHK
jgi:hypothetical protein